MKAETAGLQRGWKQETQLSVTNRATHLCKCSGVADLKHISPHMCYQAEFGRSALKAVGINKREPPKLGSAGAPLPCGRGVADP